MALHLTSDDAPDTLMASINTTPLVDVMLVLLIIFLITIPVVNTAVAVRLPQARVEPLAAQVGPIIVSVDAAGRIHWFDTPLAGPQALLARLRPLAQRPAQPEIQIRGDAAARYESVGRVLAVCQHAGIQRVSFVTQPTPAP
ncbi:MAG: biopolymer transporter ExbD [Rhodoferax sp.]